MNRKILIYFLVCCAVICSAAAYFISREMPDNNAVINGEYDIWQSVEAITETFSDIYTDETFTENYVTEALTESVQTCMITDFSETYTETTAVQFLIININTASKEELMLLEGIGEVTALKIIDYRVSSGGFRNIEEIMNVSGIGEKTFFNIRDHIYVENPFYPETITEELPIYENIIYEDDPTEAAIINLEPTIESTESPAAQTPPSSEAQIFNMKFDLNKVTLQELQSIPEIDAETAESIISLRTCIKYFSNTYELLYAEGMTEEKLRKIIEYFYVENNMN